MEETIEALRSEISDLEQKLALQLAQQKAGKSFSTSSGKVIFDQAVRQQHLAQRTPVISYLLNLPLTSHLSAPFVYGMIVPIAFLDLCVVLYQAICFRLWGAERARRGDFLLIDRQHLAYLNIIEQFNCIYCGYANGVLAFASEVAGRTEKFWCPIKHSSRIKPPHSHYDRFIAYGDSDAWQDHPSRKGKKKT